MATASAEGVQALKDTLIRWRLDRALREVWSGGGRKARYLTYLAKEMTEHPPAALPWWRLVDWMPAVVLIASVAVIAAAPAYLLALRMPIGLTRGLAMGVISGIAFGMLRGRQIRWRDLWLLALALPSVITFEGWCVAGARQGLADGTEITTAIVLALSYRDVLFGPPFLRRAELAALKASPDENWGLQARMKRLAARGPAARPWEMLAVLVAIGLSTCVTTALVSMAIHFHDPDRNPVTIFIAVVFGVGIAATAARLLIVSRDPMEPSTVSLRLYPRIGGGPGAYLAGLVSAIVVGVGGGVGGGMRLGLTYGLALTIVFGVVVGIPVGIVGGVIRWLSAPIDEEKVKESKRSPSTLRTDLTVAVAAVIGIGAAAAAGIGMLIGPLYNQAEVIDRLSTFTIVPADGILFGLTIGLIVACFNTAWPTYALTHIWLVLLGRAPIRLARFLDDLHAAEILRREGSHILFRHDEFRRYLSEKGAEFILAFENPPPNPGGPPDPRRPETQDAGPTTTRAQA